MKFAKKLFRWLRDNTAIVGKTYYKNFLFYRKLVLDVPPEHPEYHVIEYSDYDPKVFAINQKFDRGFTEERLKARFDHGLRFYELQKNGETIATKWNVYFNGDRFVDEIGLNFSLGANVTWGRDMFVAPHARGKGIFAIFSDSTIRGFFPTAKAILSVVDIKNKSAIRAHERHGHKVEGILRVLHLAGIIMWRINVIVPSECQKITGYKANKRLIFTGRAYQKYVNDHIA